MRNSEDAAFLRSVSTGTLEDFRKDKYTLSYFLANQIKFSNTEWVDVDELKDFISRQKERDASTKAHATIKQENDASDSAVLQRASPKEERVSSRVLGSCTSPEVVVKQEPKENHVPSRQTPFRTVMEDGKEVMVISDSESDTEDTNASQFPSSDTLVPEETDLEPDLDVGGDKQTSADIEMEADILDRELNSDSSLPPRPPSVWLDPDIQSTVWAGPFKLHRQLTVDYIEFLSGLPTYFPIHHEPTAFLVDLSDPKYNIKDETDKKGGLLSVDALIKNADQDSWTGPTGTGDSVTHLSIFTGSPIPCRRSRLECGGVYGCERLNPYLLEERWELDPRSLEMVVDAQVASRVGEADTPEKRALIFFIICHSAPCAAVNPSNSEHTCSGVPVLRNFKDGRTEKGKTCFISCTGYAGAFTQGHRTATIPPDVSEDHLKILFNGGTLPGFDNPPLCSRIVPAHVGGKLKTCRYVHSGDGKQYTMVKKPCPATRTIYIPVDKTIRKCLIVHLKKKTPDSRTKVPIPHNHPILPAVKASVMIRNLYLACIDAAGIVGSTVRKVDKAKTTAMILDQKIPPVVAAALQNTRLKTNLIQGKKKTAYPAGEKIAGVVLEKEKQDKKLLPEKRYIHSVLQESDGRALIVTANPFLLSLVHTADMIQVDTTFKRNVSDLDEWEVVMWENRTQRAVTIARIYSNRADRSQYKTLFDEFRKAITIVTGRPLLLKQLSRKGTLVAIGADLELGQALGAGDSFRETNEPEFSGVPTDAPVEDLLAHFIKACLGHAKRGILTLKGCLKDDDFHRIMNFFYLETSQDVEAFSSWIKGLGIKKVTDWWNHKEVNKWVLPALLKCMTKINHTDWDLLPATTNLNESQHHFTNIHTGTGLTLLEAIIEARSLDESVAQEIQLSIQTGVLKSNHSDTYLRMSNNIARATNASCKARETRERNDALDHVKENMEELAKLKKQITAREKELKATKADLTARKPSTSRSHKAESSSSGRVYGATSQSRAKEAARVNKKKSDIHAASAMHTSMLVDGEVDVDNAERIPADALSDSLLLPENANHAHADTSSSEPMEIDSQYYTFGTTDSSFAAPAITDYPCQPFDASCLSLAPNVDDYSLQTLNASYLTAPPNVSLDAQPLLDITASSNLFGQNELSQSTTMPGDYPPGGLLEMLYNDSFSPFDIQSAYGMNTSTQ